MDLELCLEGNKSPWNMVLCLFSALGWSETRKYINQKWKK